MSDPKDLLNKRLLEQQYGVNKLDSIQEQQSYIEADSFFGSRKIGRASNEVSNKLSMSNSNQKIPIFSLRNPFVLIFELFIFVITYLVFIIYIVETFYQITVLPQGAADQSIKGLIFFCFALQIILKFNVSIIVRGKEISDRRVIKFNYIKKIYNGRLFWDCISILGLLIDTFSLNFSYKWLTYLLFYSKAVFMWEFDLFALQFLQLRRRTLAIYKLFRLLLFIYFNVNLAACIFYQVGIQTLDDYGANWIQGIPYANVDGEIKWIYLYSIYWSFATMATVAYGDVTPKNPIETIYSVFIMACATLQFGYTINQVIDIITNISQGKEKVENQITAIQRYMRNKNVNQELRYRVVHYVEYQLMEDKERDIETEQHIIAMLPPNLRAELFYEINGFFFRNFNWSYKFSDQFISALCYEIEEVNIMEQTVLYEPSYVESEDDISLFYLAKGQIEVKVDLPQFNKGQGIKLNVVNENNFIGLYSFVTGTLIKEVLFCKTAVRIFIIRRQKFLETIKNFDQDLKLWTIYQNRIIQERRYEEFGLYCYNCLNTDHIIEECDLMSRKKTMLDKRQQGPQIRFTNLTQRDSSFRVKQPTDQSHVSSSQLQQELKQSQSEQNQDEKKVIIQEVDQDEESEEIKEQTIDEQQKNTKIKQDSKNPTPKHYKSDDDNIDNNQQLEKERIKNLRQGMGSKISSKIANESFIQFQEQNINEHIKHEVYNEDDINKWAQRAKIKERILRKQAFQNKRMHADQEDIVYQIISSIQNVLTQNNIDLNLMQSMSQESPHKRRTSWHTQQSVRIHRSFSKQ